MSKHVTSMTLNPAQRTRLENLARALGLTKSALMNQLIENAEIREVRRHEPFVTLSAKNANPSVVEHQDRATK